MSIKGFGNLLIFIGILFGFILFSMSEWRGGENFGVIWNIRYAKLFSYNCSGVGFSRSCESVMRLGHGLSVPLFIIFVGLAFVREIIPQKLIVKYMPFLKKDNDIK